MTDFEDVWEVVGGTLEGGIIVRTGVATTSSLVESRLTRGALIRALRVLGNRLLFRLISGSGPEEGWVSIMVKGTPLLVRKHHAPVGHHTLFNWDELDECEARESRRRARSLPPERLCESDSENTEDDLTAGTEDATPPLSEAVPTSREENECSKTDLDVASCGVAPADGCILLGRSDEHVCEGTLPAGNETLTAEEEVTESAVGSDFKQWLEQRRPLLRMSSAFVGSAWDFPLAKNEKRELLLAHVAAGERASVDAAAACAEAAAYEAAQRSRVEAELRQTTRALKRNSSLRPQHRRSGGLAKKHRLSIGRKRVSIV